MWGLMAMHVNFSKCHMNQPCNLLLAVLQLVRPPQWLAKRARRMEKEAHGRAVHAAKLAAAQAKGQEAGHGTDAGSHSPKGNRVQARSVGAASGTLALPLSGPGESSPRLPATAHGVLPQSLSGASAQQPQHAQLLQRTEKHSAFELFLPSTLLLHPLPLATWSTLCGLPSLLRRLEALAAAHELRDTVLPALRQVM